MMLRKSKILLVIMLMGLMQPLFAQQDIIKAYADSSSVKNYCFYPSTLRMLNLVGSEDYNKMVEGIEKLLIYSLDSAALADKSYQTMLEEYKANDFEEFATMWGGDNNFSIYGKESRVNEFVGVFRNESDLYAFFLIGMIDFAKIPALIQNFNQDDMLNVFTLNSR